MPTYRSELRPGIVHFGAGAFHRSHQAVYLDDLFGTGRDLDWGIVGVGTTSADLALHDALQKQDHLYTVETRHGDGRTDYRVIASMAQHHMIGQSRAILDELVSPNTKWVTLTVTEGGYPSTPEAKATGPASFADVRAALPVTASGLIVRALAERRATGVEPFVVVSCDNLQHNGQIAAAAVTAYAGALDEGLADWIEGNVRFPSSMVDRITPATSAADVVRIANATGQSDECPVVAEPYREWILEDVEGARPALEEVGVRLVPDVSPYEKLKLRILNGGHQALAYAGLLRGHSFAHEAAADQLVVDFLRRFLRDEVVPTLDDVPGVDPFAYVELVLDRFSNSHLPDPLTRLAAHSGDRMPIFVLSAAAESRVAGRRVPVTSALVAMWRAVLQQDRETSCWGLNNPPADLAVQALVAGEGELRSLRGDTEFLDSVTRSVTALERGGVDALLATVARGESLL